MANAELIKIDADEYGVTASKAEQIEAVFVPMVSMLKEFEADFHQVMDDSVLEIDDALCKRAKRLRLDIATVRHATEKERKAQKEEFLRAGKAIDGVSNILQYAVREKEDKLKEIENFFELKEANRIQKLYDSRLDELTPYMLESTHVPDLGTMDEDVWIHFRDGMKSAHDARIKAEKQAEADRVAKAKADAAEKERLEEEAAQAKMDAAAARIEADKAKEEAAKVKREAAAEAKARQDKEDADAKVKADAEQAERDRIAAEEADKKRKADALAKADDQEKLDVFGKTVWALLDEMPTLKDKKRQKELKTAIQSLHALTTWEQL